MAYTIYKNIKVLGIKQEQVSPMRRTKDITDPVRKRPDYAVTVARFSDAPCDFAIGEFKNEIHTGQYVSVAVNANWEIIAVVNHTTGNRAALQRAQMKFSDISGILFFLAIPLVVIFFIARKAFQTVKYHDLGWAFIGIGVLIAFLVLRGINKQYTESQAALRELPA